MEELVNLFLPVVALTLVARGEVGRGISPKAYKKLRKGELAVPDCRHQEKGLEIK